MSLKDKLAAAMNRAKQSPIDDGGKKKKTGKKTEKPTYSSKSWSSKEQYPGQEKSRTTRSYNAEKSGVVRSTTYKAIPTKTVGGSETTSYPEKHISMDTTGYSSGKPTFKVKKYTRNVADVDYSDNLIKDKYSEYDIPRSKVKKQIEYMKAGSGIKAKEKKSL